MSKMPVWLKKNVPRSKSIDILQYFWNKFTLIGRYSYM